MKKLFSSDHAVTIAPSTIIFTVLFLLGLYLVYYVHQILITLFLAIIVMAALRPSVRWLETKLRFPRILAILVMYLLLILFLAISLTLIIPPLISEVPNLITSLNLPPLPEHIRSLDFSVAELSTLFNQFRSSFSTILAVITSTFTGIFTLFTVLVMSSYLLLDRENLHKKIAWFSREKRHLELAKEFVDKAEVQLGGWVRGQLFLMLAIGIITYIGLSLLSIPYAVPLAITAGLLEILPNLGPTLAAVPAVAIAYFTTGPAMAGFIVLFYTIVQQLENNLIVPKIMKDNVDVNPLTTILVILIGFKVGSVIGALLAVPFYILVRSIYSLWLREQENPPTPKAT